MDWSWLRNIGDFLRKERKVSLDDFKKASDAARELNEWLRSFLPIGPEVLSEMSYESAISYFVDARPNDSRVAKGAMILQSHPQGHLLSQVFLDASSDLVEAPDGKPYGRRLVVKRLDAELERTFGDKDLVIVE